MNVCRPFKGLEKLMLFCTAKAFDGSLSGGYNEQRHPRVALVISAVPGRAHGQLDREPADAWYGVIRGEDTLPDPFMQQSVVSRLATVTGSCWISLDVLTVRVNARASGALLCRDVCQLGRIARKSGGKRQRTCDARVYCPGSGRSSSQAWSPILGPGLAVSQPPTRRPFNEKGLTCE